MNEVINAEHSLLVDAVQQFLDGEGLAVTGRTGALDATDAAALWRDCARMGWTLACVPEECDGVGLPLPVVASMAEEMGKRLLPLPVADATAINALLHRGVEQCDGADALRDRLAGWLGGDALLAIVRGAGAGSGRPFAEFATPGIPALDLSWAEGMLTVTAVATEAHGHGVDPLIPVGLPADGAPAWRHEVPCGANAWQAFCGLRRALRLGELLGVGAQALALASAHAREREQFGKPIGINQAVKHRLADNWMALDNARLVLQDACGLLDEAGWHSPAGRDAEAALLTAVLLVTEAAHASTAQAIQTHGAMGITWECPVHFFLKRARHLGAILAHDGDETAMLDRLWALG
ncbi:acyl-CoA dehydrogenase [Paracandidimonas lactea]|uniref:acyl-CoA dehydrogenase n=1 Tax=Paracandidimonas lactea TaxID=2895524 RepID=UPI001F1FBEF7|nr:acyl-CoA dehydrogenase [Paracandidimonas lactea]